MVMNLRMPAVSMSRLPRRRKSPAARFDPDLGRLALAAGAGGLLAYLLDPDRGARRRHMARDRALATLRRGASLARRSLRAASAQSFGVAQRLTHLASRGEMPPNDVTLAHKIESEVFGSGDVPKGQINVNVEHGIAVLRGEVGRPEIIKRIEEAVRRVTGVRDVENLLHLPGTPASRSQAAHRVG